MSSQHRFDVVVLGSGFGGSLLAAILSRQGLRVGMVDRDTHPRFAIGESSTPAADLILHSLAVRYSLERIQPLCRFGTWQASSPHVRCGCKRGFTYISHAANQGYRATHDHRCELLVAASANQATSDTHWYRPDVDQLFCETAVEAGVAYFSRTRIREICELRSGGWSIRADQNESQQLLHCRMIVDATGAAGVLLEALGVGSVGHQLRTNSAAIYSHFENVPKTEDWLRARGAVTREFPFPADDAAVHHLFADGWLWQLAFNGGLVSLGFVADASREQPFPASSPAANWAALLDRHPVLKEILRGSRLAAVPGKVLQSQRLQRMATVAAGDHWAALPHTAGFIDPLHSTGIAHTLIGVQRLAEILMEPERIRTERLAHYSFQLQRELKFIDLLVSGCYRTLSDFERFTAWSMLYFAVATTFEQSFADGHDDFLCAADATLPKDVLEAYESLFESEAPPVSTREFRECLRSLIQPINHVGLFEPEVPNMYRYTAANKL